MHWYKLRHFHKAVVIKTLEFCCGKDKWSLPQKKGPRYGPIFLEHFIDWVPKNWCFWTVVWRRLLRVPWTARRSKQSILKETNSEYSLEGLILKLKLQYSDHLMWRAHHALEKVLTLSKIEGRRRRGWPRKRWLHGITYLMDMSLSELWETAKDREAWHDTDHGFIKGQTWLSVSITTAILLDNILV